MYSGTISTAISRNPKGRTLSKTTVRVDYRKRAEWTYGEAADFALISPKTVANYLCARKFLSGNRVGPLRVDAESFMQYVKTAKPLRRRKKEAAAG